MPALFDRQQIYDRFLKPQVRHKNWPTHCTAPIVNTAGRPFPLSPYWVCGPPPLKSPCFPPLVSGGLKRCRAVYLRRVHHGALRAKPPRQTPPAHAFSVCRQAADVNKHSWGLWAAHPFLHPFYTRQVRRWFFFPFPLTYELSKLLSGLAINL